MAQTANALSGKALDVGLSTDGSSWTAVEGFSTSVEVSGGDRATGTAYTADGDFPILTVGKRAEATVTLNAVYTEAGSDPFAMAKTSYEGGSSLYLRWSPAGIASGNDVYYTGASAIATPGTPAAGDFDYESVVTSIVYPPVDASSGDPISLSIVFMTASIATDTVP